MQLSHEQLAIIESKGNIIVNSGAGCSKTMTAVEYARRRPGQKILYIAFNKSIRVEGEKRFLKAGVSNVKIETAHSLAYGGMHVRDRYTLCNGGNMKAKRGGRSVRDQADHCRWHQVSDSGKTYSQLP